MAAVFRHRPGVLTRVIGGLAIAAVVGVAPAGYASTAFVDAVLADVNGAIVTASDAAIVRALGLFDTPPADAPIRAVDVDRLVDAWLIAQEAARLQILPSPAEAEEAWRTVAARMGGMDRLHRWLDRSGIDEAWAKKLVEADLRRQRFIDMRFRAFVFVTEEDVTKTVGTALSSPEDRQRVFESLREAAVARELAAWLAEARSRAAIGRTDIPPAGVPFPFATR